MSYSYDGDEFGDPKILVVGCGYEGCRMVTRLAYMGPSGAKTLCLDTDRIRLGGMKADGKILMEGGIAGAVDAGGDPGAGRNGVEGSRGSLREALRGCDLVFVAAGLGDAAAGGAAAAICETARDLGATTVAIFALPPGSYGGDGMRLPIGSQDIEGLAKSADTLILLDPGKVLEMEPDLSADQALSVIDQLAAEIVKGIAETVTETSLINLDYADLKTVVSRGGLSAVLVGESDSKEGPEEIVGSALTAPLADLDTRGATGCLLHITGGCDLTLRKAASIASVLTGLMGPGGNVIWGARVKEGFEGKIRILAIMTGVGIPNALSQQKISQGR
ncbi:cell division protein FtsZ [Candidatus Methanocrinis natronophilus]|nr:cell division protein FtsZ [Candidatus Methanocrinis natronophilus]